MKKRNGSDVSLTEAIALQAEHAAVDKIVQSAGMTFFLAASAGIFVAIATVFHTVLQTGPRWIGLLSSGLCFTLGLIPVILCRADLCPAAIPMTNINVRIHRTRLAGHAFAVCCGNLAGILFFAALLFISGLYLSGNGHWGLKVLEMASKAGQRGVITNFALGIAGNFLLGGAVALSYMRRSLSDKIIAMMLPVCLFTALGAAHFTVGLLLIPLAIVIRDSASASFWLLTNAQAAQYPALTWGNLLGAYLIPVMLGNMIGGRALIVLLYGRLTRKQ